MKIKFLRSRASTGLNTLVNRLKERREEDYNIKRLNYSSRYKGNNRHLIINWGSTNRQEIKDEVAIVNRPELVRMTADKVLFFSRLTQTQSPHYFPRWTTNLYTASELIETEGATIYCRTLTRASQGRGIVVASSIEDLVEAPLYTVKEEVDREFRVHVFNGYVIDYAQKKRMRRARREEEEIELNNNIRNLSNGWIFAREGVDLPDNVGDLSIEVVDSFGLNFGAVDIIITPQGNAKVLEINSAPGLEGTTLDSYCEAFLSLFKKFNSYGGF